MIALALLTTSANSAPLTDLYQPFDAVPTGPLSGQTTTQNGHTGTWLSGYGADPWNVSGMTLGGQTRPIWPITDEQTGQYGGASDPYDNHLTYTGREWRDLTVSALLFEDGPSNQMDSIGLVFRWTNSSNYYMVFTTWIDGPGLGTGNGVIRSAGPGVYLFRVAGGFATEVAKLSGPDLQRRQWTLLQAEVTGATITVKMDMNNDRDVADAGETMITFTDPTPLNTLGRAGLFAFDAGFQTYDVGFDEFKVVIDDLDSDLDGVPDARDNCLTIPNPTQADVDLDRIGDPCDGADADADLSFTPADCNDSDPSIHPGAAESCDNVDSDCDLDLVDGFVDTDKDKTPDCVDPDDDDDGVTDTSDCKPFDGTIYPGAPESCDAIDSNCNGDLVDTFADTDVDKSPDCVDTDDDGDGAFDSADCAPTDKTVHPGATEVCDDIDSDCDGDKVDTFADTDVDKAPDCVDLDDDGDGVVDTSDCKSLDKTIYPGALEVCDAFDQDCDGNLIETFANFDGDALPDCADLDDDDDGSSDTLDCNDFDKTVYPGALESQCDTIDSNCNGSNTDGLDGDFDGDGKADCTDLDDDDDGSLDTADCDDFNAAIKPGATELCDAIDSNCDGDIVDTFTDTDFDKFPDCIDPDDDGDGSLDAADCAPTNKTIFPGAVEACDTIDSDCDLDFADGYPDFDGDKSADCIDLNDDNDPSPDAVDCDDANAAIYPGALELCDYIDSDCDNSLVDTFTDTDKDTVPDCTDPDDDDDAEADGTDCAPLSSAVNHGATEVCNGVDDDCSGKIDDAYAVDASTWYLDADNDGVGLASALVTACGEPAGHVATSGDCNDADNTIRPSADEICDGRDQDCDGYADDDDPDDVPVDAYEWYVDSDSDTYGDYLNFVLACVQPSGTTDFSLATDCDDTNADANPSGIEVCGNAIDDDCDGIVDKDAGSFPWWIDADHDGYGDSSTTPTDDCGPPGNDWVGNGDDCDDSDATASPAEDEQPGNGKDDDCDPATSDEVIVDTSDTGGDTSVPDTDTSVPDTDTTDTAPLDSDGDGVAAGDDCDDDDATIHPGAEELVDAIDQDCDGLTDPAAQVHLRGCGCVAGSSAPRWSVGLLALFALRSRRRRW